MIRLAWTLCLSLYTGAHSWSQITAGWAWPEPQEAATHTAMFIPLTSVAPLTLICHWSLAVSDNLDFILIKLFASVSCKKLGLFTTLYWDRELCSLPRRKWAVWWCVTTSCRVCNGTTKAAATRLTPLSTGLTPSCACTLFGTSVWWMATHHLCQLKPLQGWWHEWGSRATHLSADKSTIINTTPALRDWISDWSSPEAPIPVISYICIWYKWSHIFPQQLFHS